MSSYKFAVTTKLQVIEAKHGKFDRRKKIANTFETASEAQRWIAMQYLTATEPKT